MTFGYGISGIGLNPLGNMGLGAMGTYGSYDAYMPSMLGMTGMGMGMNGSIFGMGGMGGMMSYYPQYMTQMQEAQNQMEVMKAQHAGNMHQVLLNNEVSANRETDSALMQKVLTNSDIQQGVKNLYAKVREGDQNGICQMFDELRTYVYNTYKDELAARSDKINPAASAAQYIEGVYGNIISSMTGEPHDLRTDIKQYGDGSFENGFLQGYRKDHHDRYIDETLNYCFGLPIDQKGSKDFKQKMGYGLGVGANVLEKGVLGAIGGVALAGAGAGVSKIFGGSFFKNLGRLWKPAMLLGAAAGIAADIWWKYSDNTAS